MKPIIIAAMLACGSAHAQFYSGNSLFGHMTGDAESRYHAMGYVMGVHDAMDQILFCTPSNITAGQLRDVVKMSLERDPANRNKSASLLIVNTLQQVWPCKKQGGQL
jgi:Rap1a immunity proteins